MTAFTSWREPTREEFPVGIAALSKIVGAEEAVSPIWTRRLALSDDGATWLLVISSGGKPTIETFAPWADPIQLQVSQTAYPLAEGVAILRGPNNPEAILAGRRAQVAAHETEVAAAQAKARAIEAARMSEAAKLEADQRQFNYAGWVKLDAWQMAFLGLAVRIKDRDPKLAADLREIANEGRGSHPSRPAFPRAGWER